MCSLGVGISLRSFFILLLRLKYLLNRIEESSTFIIVRILASAMRLQSDYKSHINLFSGMHIFYHSYRSTVASMNYLNLYSKSNYVYRQQGLELLNIIIETSNVEVERKIQPDFDCLKKYEQREIKRKKYKIE